MKAKERRGGSRSRVESMGIPYRVFAFMLVAVILAELVVVAVTTTIFHSFVDGWGFKVYFETLVIPFLSAGKLPYIDTFWEYPVLMLVPTAIATIPVVVFKSSQLFPITFQAVMTIIQAATCTLVYLLTLKIYQNKTRAMFAGILYAIGVAAVYITLTNFDPMPTFFVMLGLTMTVYGTDTVRNHGYLSYVLGFFTKIYPIVILPLLVLYNAKTSSIKLEIKNVVISCGLVASVLFIPIFLINPDSVATYLVSNATGKPIFVESFVYVIYSWITVVFKVPVPVSTVANLMTVIMLCVFVVMAYLIYAIPGRDPKVLVDITLIMLVTLIACTKYHSPQYMLWVMPILCVLVSGDLVNAGIYYVLQIIWYVKFPLLFYGYYTNTEYVHAALSAGWWTILVFFTVEYLALFYLVWKVTGVREYYRRASNQGVTS